VVIKYTARRNCTGTRRSCNGNWEEKTFRYWEFSFVFCRQQKTYNSCSKPINSRQDTERQPDRQTGALARRPYHKFL